MEIYRTLWEYVGNAFWNLHSAEASKEGNNGDDRGNDDDDVGGGGVEADVKLSLKTGDHWLRLESWFSCCHLCDITLGDKQEWLEAMEILAKFSSFPISVL